MGHTRAEIKAAFLHSSEEDVHNPADFATVVEQWLAAWSRYHPDSPDAS